MEILVILMTGTTMKRGGRTSCNVDETMEAGGATAPLLLLEPGLFNPADNFDSTSCAGWWWWWWWWWCCGCC